MKQHFQTVSLATHVLSDFGREHAGPKALLGLQRVDILCGPISRTTECLNGTKQTVSFPSSVLHATIPMVILLTVMGDWSVAST